MKTIHKPSAGGIFAKASALIALGVLFSPMLNAQTDTVSFNRYLLSTGQKSGDYHVLIHTHAQAMYPGSNADAYRQLFNSTSMLGYVDPSIRLTRALDISEDWQYNFIDPNDGDDTKTYYGTFYVSGGNSTWTVSPTFTNTASPFYGQNVIDNPNILGMGDDKFLLWNDAKKSVSTYATNTSDSSYHEYSWTTFSGGAFGGAALEGMLSHMIGFESSNMYFLGDDGSTVIAYNYTTGSYSSSDSGVFTFTDPLFAGYTLGDIIDGKHPDFTYVGWDEGAMILGVPPVHVVPEPAECALLFGAMGLLAAAYRRRKS